MTERIEMIESQPYPYPAIDPVQWANLMSVWTPELQAALVQANTAMSEHLKKMQADIALMDDDALRLALGEDTLAWTARMNADCSRWSTEDRDRTREAERGLMSRMGFIRDEMARRGIYNPNADYTYAVRMRWLEKEAAENVERARRISRYLPWRSAEKDYGI